MISLNRPLPADVVNLRFVVFTVTVFFVSPDVTNLSVRSPASVLATVSVSPADSNSQPHDILVRHMQHDS